MDLFENCRFYKDFVNFCCDIVECVELIFVFNLI